MNHQTAKILLIIVGAIFSAFNMLSSAAPSNQGTYDSNGYEYQYEYGPDSNIDVDYQTY